MRHSSLLVVTVFAAALAGCGADGPDGPGAAFDLAAAESGAAGIQVIAGASDDDHGEATLGHDEADAIGHDEGSAMPESGDGLTDATHVGGDEADAIGHDDADAPMHDEPDDAHEALEVVDDAPDAVGHDEPTGEIEADDGGGLVVEVEMLEFAFTFDATTVPMGEPVTFRFHNTGDVEHEAMFGSAHQQEEFAAAAGDHSESHGGDTHHGDVAAITLAAGATGDLVLQFDTPDEIWIGCHIAGHWDAGMQSTIRVA